MCVWQNHDFMLGPKFLVSGRKVTGVMWLKFYWVNNTKELQELVKYKTVVN